MFGKDLHREKRKIIGGKAGAVAKPTFENLKPA